MNEPTQKQTYFYMKMAATSLMIFILLALYWHSQGLEEQRAHQMRSYVPDLSLVSARTPSLITAWTIGIPSNLVAPEQRISQVPPQLNSSEEQRNENPSEEVPSDAPQLVHLKDFKNQLVHFIFWASWCQPCQTELPILEKIYQELNQQKSIYQVVLINLDETLDGQQEALKLQRQLMPSAQNVFVDARDLARLAKVEALPFHMIVDGESRIATAFTNTIDSPEKQKAFHALVNQLRSELKL